MGEECSSGICPYGDLIPDVLPFPNDSLTCDSLQALFMADVYSKSMCQQLRGYIGAICCEVSTVGACVMCPSGTLLPSIIAYDPGDGSTPTTCEQMENYMKTIGEAGRCAEFQAAFFSACCDSR